MELLILIKMDIMEVIQNSKGILKKTFLEEFLKLSFMISTMFLRSP